MEDGLRAAENQLKGTGRVLFICVENRFRSQVAEALFNSRAPVGWTAVSAGSRPAAEVHPWTMLLLHERRIDISGKATRLLTEEIERSVDIAITVCEASECPVVRVPHVEGWEIPDPSSATLEEARRIVSAIEAKVDDLIRRIMRGEVPRKGGLSSQFIVGGSH